MLNILPKILSEISQNSYLLWFLFPHIMFQYEQYCFEILLHECLIRVFSVHRLICLILYAHFNICDSLQKPSLMTHEFWLKILT